LNAELKTQTIIEKKEIEDVQFLRLRKQADLRPAHEKAIGNSIKKATASLRLSLLCLI